MMMMIQVRPPTCVSPKAGVVHGGVPVLVHEVHVGLVAEEQLHNLGDRHYRLFDNVTIVIIVINIIITTKGKPPCVHGPWQDAEVCRRPYWLCELVPRDRSIG